MNPGVGLWSSKLHDAIKPRSHILLEPNIEFYQPYIQPLLDKEDSKYKLIPKSGILWDTLNMLKSQDYLPSQELFPKGDARLEKPNDSLLFIANLGYFPGKSYQGFPSIALLMVNQLLTAVRSHSIFQGYGLVRMLVWMRDKEKKPVFPRLIPYRRKFAVEAEISCENIYEIAGSDEEVSTWRRERGLDIEGARTVYNKMKEANVTTSTDRISTLQKEALLIRDSSIKDSIDVVRPFNRELEELEARYARREFCAYIDKDGNPVYLTGEPSDAKKRGGTGRTPEYLRLKELRYRLKHVQGSEDKLDRLLSEYESIIAEQLAVAQLGTPDAEERRRQLQEQFSTCMIQFDHLKHNNRILMSTRIDDRRAFHQNPPILLWDRRQAEPLVVKEKDFFPQQEMCLLDFHPKSVWPIIQGRNISNYDYFEFILSVLFLTPRYSIVRTLKGVAPGADEWIIPRCPTLTNPAKGGALDPEQLNIRCLNQDMLREIMEAWMSWPFRPTKAEMLVRLGNRQQQEDDAFEFEQEDN